MMRIRPMKHSRYIVATFALVSGLAVGLTPGTAGASSPFSLTKQTLTDTNRDCNGTQLSTSTKTSGAAYMLESPRIFSLPASLSLLVTVEGATPGATYNIRIIQDGASGLVGSCDVVVGKVTTDAKGNGVMLATTPVLAGATKWWVDLNNQQNVADFVDTDLVAIG